MLFQRDGAHGLDAPLPPDATPKPDFPDDPMLEANGGDFPSDPEALPSDWLGTDLCAVVLLPESADHTRDVSNACGKMFTVNCSVPESAIASKT
jgi:hypothetical protein